MELNEKERAILLAMCRNDLNLTGAARELHYHRNGIAYQVERLERKTGYNISTFYGALQLLLDILWKDDNQCLTQQQSKQK